MPEEWLTLQRAEELFCIPVATWRRWLRERRLGYYRLGGRILIQRADVEEWLSKNFREPLSARQTRNAPRGCGPGGEAHLDPTSILARIAASAAGLAGSGGG